MSKDVTGDATAELSTLLSKGWTRLKGHVFAAIGGLALALGAIVWRKPDLFVGLLAAAVMTAAVLYAVAYMRLHARAVSREKKALAEVERLQLLNAMARRTLLMQEESIYHILLAWTGADSSARALDETMPHNNLVKGAVGDLRSKRGVVTNVRGIHELLIKAQGDRKKVEEQIGPDRVHQKVTISFTTHGNREVEIEPLTCTGAQAEVD